VKNFVTEANGVEDKCCDGVDRMVEAGMTNNGFKEEVNLFTFRNSFEVKDKK
jgi:hypothetical protein